VSVKVCVLGSGSKGNCTAVWTDNTILLVDAGKLAVRYIRESLAAAGLQVSDVSGVLITHCHTDHLSDTTYRLCGRHRIPVYCSGPTWEAALRRKSNRRLEQLEKEKLLRERPKRSFRVGDFTVTPFRVSHSHGMSAGEPVGYSLEANGFKVSYATDLGLVTPEIEERLAGSDILVLESNHDVEMELNSGRPRDTIEWVLGDTGHLSNEQCAKALGNLKKLGGRAPKHVVLAHISEECNLPELALSASARSLGRRKMGLIHAMQKKPTPILST
jgi:phosphoribosyl 1,2-cyclic phosphodiesterase